MDSFAAITGSSFILAVTEFGLELIDVECKVLSLHVLWVRYLFEHADLPGLLFFRHYIRVAFGGHSVQQILHLSTTSNSASDLLPPFYHSVMELWFCFSRQLEDGGIVIVGSVASSGDGVASSCLSVSSWPYLSPDLACSKSASFRPLAGSIVPSYPMSNHLYVLP